MTGYALHVGASLPFTPDGQPPGYFPDLPSAEDDARALAAITKSAGFRVACLLGAEATYANVSAELAAACGVLGPGETFVFTYSGHGWQLWSDDPSDKDHKDEALVLHDRQVVDNELWHTFQRAPAGAVIVFIADACHSATMARFAPLDVNTTLAEMLTVVHRTAAEPPDAMPTVMTLAATASDEGETAETDHGGVFTGALCQAWSELKSKRPSWSELMVRAAQIMAVAEVPVEYREGPHITLYAGNVGALDGPAFTLP